jgi:hypothetical protein
MHEGLVHRFLIPEVKSRLVNNILQIIFLVFAISLGFYSFPGDCLALVTGGYFYNGLACIYARLKYVENHSNKSFYKQSFLLDLKTWPRNHLGVFKGFKNNFLKC